LLIINQEEVIDLVLLKLDYVDLDVGFIMPLKPAEPEDFLQTYQITAKYPLDPLDFESEETITVAEAILVLLDPTRKGIRFRTACDDYSADLLELYYVLYDKNNDLKRPPLDGLIFQDIWYLEHLIVHSEYRKQGLGAAMIDWIINYLCRDRGAVIVWPYPMEISKLENGNIRELENIDSPEEKKDMIKFFEKQGFFQLWATNYMYRVAEWNKGVRAL
jgi:GNAT superfamily N-acetyltransferase